MKTKLLAILIAAGLAFNADAQSDITTLIFVRHAEKVNDGSKDPELSPEGMQRARRLSEMLSDQRIDAIYTTDFKRTRNTVSPLAAGMKLMLTVYALVTPEQLRGIIQQYKGGTVVICGHSNTTPDMLNMLVGENTFKQWNDDEYGNLVVVSVPASGQAKYTMLHY